MAGTKKVTIETTDGETVVLGEKDNFVILVEMKDTTKGYIHCDRPAKYSFFLALREKVIQDLREVFPSLDIQSYGEIIGKIQ